MTRRATTRAVAAVAAAKPLRTTASVIALAVATAGIGIGGAPLAAAGPAPNNVESLYLLSLEVDHNVKLPTAKHEELAVLMGYLVCKIKKLNGVVPDDGLVYLVAADDTGLCSCYRYDGHERSSSRIP